MGEERDAWETLRAAGFLHAAREAHRAATLVVFGGMSRSAGFKERSYGTSAFDVLESRLDRVFGIEDGEPGPIVRDDLNTSPGWRCGRYRVLLKRHPFGAVRSLRWDRDSPTKQAVARQEFADDPQLAFELPGIPSDTPGIVTLVLAHSAVEEPLDMELFLGRPRFNDDGGSPWHWVRALDDASLGADPRRKLVEPTLPLWTDDSADVLVRRRSETSTETAW
ncbi:hypothetical protein [Actinomadura atramentaria]|uniref:hypothetical protein n=1 Tax=Actinomadura atramentaria TaxID=1990 RepID=UPI00036E1A56|nr:hypothetical protein [Actinomadura atramentaria]